MMVTNHTEVSAEVRWEGTMGKNGRIPKEEFNDTGILELERLMPLGSYVLKGFGSRKDSLLKKLPTRKVTSFNEYVKLRHECSCSR
jgi:hypothetical protein